MSEDAPEPDEGPDEGPDLAGALEDVEVFLLGEAPSLTRLQVVERAGVPLEVATELWRLMGFPHVGDDEVVFTPADVKALGLSNDLMELGILSPDRQAALVRTWGRSFARLAEWQTTLLSDVALESGEDPTRGIPVLAEQVLPRVGELQDYVWRRHLASASSRQLAVAEPGSPVARLAVCFVDIVGFTSRSKELDESGLVGWIEHFEAECSGIVTDLGGRVIKNIGDEVLLVCDEPTAAAETALVMAERGASDQDDFPEVRAGVAYGEVVSRLGDVFGPTVNIAARLTSIARPGAVLVDNGMHDALTGRDDDTGERTGSGARGAPAGEDGAYRLRHMRRTPVKGYAKLQPWVLRRTS